MFDLNADIVEKRRKELAAAGMKGPYASDYKPFEDDTSTMWDDEHYSARGAVMGMMNEMLTSSLTQWQMEENPWDLWNGKASEAIIDGIEDQEPVLNAVGSAMVSAVYAGAVSAMQGLNFGAMGGGGSPISNLYINQMNMNNGTDAEGLASLVQKELFMARRGFGG